MMKPFGFYFPDGYYFSFYFKEFRIQESREKPLYDMWGLIADVGATLGFFLGASVLTLVDAVADWAMRRLKS